MMGQRGRRPDRPAEQATVMKELAYGAVSWALAFVARGATPESFAAGGAHAPLCLLNFLGSSRTLGVVSRSA